MRGEDLVSFTYSSGRRPQEPNWLVGVSHRKRKPRSDKAGMVSVRPVKNLTDQSIVMRVLWGDEESRSLTSIPFIHSIPVSLEFLK